MGPAVTTKSADASERRGQNGFVVQLTYSKSKYPEQGDATAQYLLGVSCAFGEGVLKDAVLAHMWFNIASANGNEAAGELRDTFVEDNMTRDEISRAIELARTCMTSDSKTANRKRR